MIKKEREAVNRVVPDGRGMVTTGGRVMSKAAYAHNLNYKQEYDREKYKRIFMRLRFNQDAMLLDYLSKQKNVSQFLRELVVEKMKKDIKKGTYVPEGKGE